MTVRVALIGCGFIGRFHSAAIRAVVNRELLDVEYVAVCDENADRARSFARITGAEATTDAAAVIDSPDIDALHLRADGSPQGAGAARGRSRQAHLL